MADEFFQYHFSFFFVQKCGEEAEAINIDENLLQLEVTAFPTLQEMIDKMNPIEKLWKTAYKFDKCHELWLVDPLNFNLYILICCRKTWNIKNILSEI